MGYAVLVLSLIFSPMFNLSCVSNSDHSRKIKVVRQIKYSMGKRIPPSDCLIVLFQQAKTPDIFGVSKSAQSPLVTNK